MDIIFASKNDGKIKEVKAALDGQGINVISMEEAGIAGDIVEDGETYEANALKKAEYVCRLTNRPALADDSGIEIDFFGKQPGVYSSRYLGVQTPYSEKNQIILGRMSGTPDSERAARYVCVMAAAFPGGHTHTVRGEWEGAIARQASDGQNGFGYDPIFFLPECQKAASDIPLCLKNKISHRGRALGKMKAYLLGYEEKGNFS